jgi:predicted nucleic acid-binding protein
MKIVVDASAAISWALDDERDDLARAMASEVLAHGGYVPPLFAPRQRLERPARLYQWSI